jgi:pimeloyl-ACP methyl ester carboxylesterase
MAGPIPPWPGELVALDTGQLFVRSAPAVLDSGEGGQAAGAGGPAEPAVFVHGLGGSARNWTDLMDLLSHPGPPPGPAGPVMDCEAPDLPGFGHSPVPADRDYSIGAHARAVIALIDKRGRWPVHLVGNSLGGAVCTRVAARRPDLVRSLTLVSPALPDLRPRPGPLRVAAASLPGLGPWALRHLEAVPPERRTAQTIRELYGDPSLLHPDRFREEVEEVIRRDGTGYQADALLGSARAIVGEYLRWGPGTLWRDAARVTAPALVIHGSEDRLVSPATAGRAARSFHSAHVVVLPKVGHVAMMERPDVVARIMRSFLAQAGDGRPAARAGAAPAGVPPGVSAPGRAAASRGGEQPGPGELNQVSS